MTWPFGRQTPDNNLMRFVSRRIPPHATILDIGSGEGANARELYLRGHMVFSIDKDPNVEPPIWEMPGAHCCGDICDLGYTKGPFDLIYDVNTLCHVKDPPFKKIKGWLKGTGVFFSICPQFGSSSRVMEGKEYTRFLSLREAQSYGGGIFSKVLVGSATYRLPEEKIYASWIIEARP